LWLNWYLYIYWTKILSFYFYKNNWLLIIFNNFKTESNVYQINSLTTFHYLFNKYNDVISITFVWIIGGFPPFILFITKFYIICYAWSKGLTIVAPLVWFIINTLGIYGYIRGISFIIIRFKKDYFI
jgi:NADH:ubiquinone oxidoreductase subunit 2 (subunit N)